MTGIGLLFPVYLVTIGLRLEPVLFGIVYILVREHAWTFYAHSVEIVISRPMVSGILLRCLPK